MPIEPIQIELSLGIMFPSVNCFLIPGEELTLIDCGLHSKENWKRLQDRLEEHGYKVKDIEQVIITHEHRDHIGLLPEIIANSNAIIRIPKSIEKWIVQPEQMKTQLGTFNKKLFGSLGFPEKVLDQVFQFIDIVELGKKIEPTDRLHFFKEGDYLRFGNTDWEVLNTPGHSPTQYVFLQKEQRRIFGSDMLLPIAPMPIIMEDANRKGEPTRSLNALLNSFQRLKQFDIQTVYPGHGPIFSNANAVIDKQLSRIQMRKEECFEAVKEGHLTPYQINRKMYPYQSIPPDFSGMYMVLGYIDLLQQEGRISKSIDENGIINFSIK